MLEFLDQYRDLKIIYKKYVGEELMSFFISYPDMKNFYPIQVIDFETSSRSNNSEEKSTVGRIQKRPC